MRVFLLVIIFSLFCFPLIGLAASLSNAGFLQGGIWYSKDPFFAGETVRVYAALFNSGSEDIAGSVEFFDNGYSLGTSDFFVEHSGKFAQVWVDWNTSEGEHLVEAIITEASAIRIGKEAVPIQLQQNVAQQSARRVQMDSDGDGIGNDDDIDDDNDGISDAQELLQGTNPLVPLTLQEEAAIAGEKQEVKAKEDDTITETLIALLPDAVEVRAVAVHEAAQKMLVPVVKLVEEKKEEATQGAEAIRKNPEARQTEKVQASLYAASLSGAVFILKTEALLYLVSLLFAYLFLRMILRRMFG
ncbi:MAG: hypothetical protein U1C72_01430, partial [Candidatus Pacearchaeota archaeon]|nr:hypothetical protein [Candidatus Pacearchaeota archaeon]